MTKLETEYLEKFVINDAKLMLLSIGTELVFGILFLLNLKFEVIEITNWFSILCCIALIVALVSFFFVLIPTMLKNLNALYAEIKRLEEKS